MENNRFAEWFRAHRKIALTLKILIYSYLFIVVMFAFTVLVDEGTKSPIFCGKFCHEMAPEYYTFKNSAHSSFDCVECHAQTSDQGYIEYRLVLMKFLVNHFSGAYTNPIKLGHTIPDEACQKCHSTKRQFSPSGDLLVPHDKHLAKGIPCIKCHAGVTHGLIAERGMANKDSYDKWDAALAEKNIKPFYSRPKMQTCLDCHTERKVTTDCKACHKVITLPFSHSNPVWKTTHGKTAKTSSKRCADCHASSDQAPFKFNNVGDVSAEFAQYTNFCYSCHQKRPAGHTADWMKLHRTEAKVKGTKNCSTCHSLNKPSSNNFTETYCNKCHWFSDFNSAISTDVTP